MLQTNEVTILFRDESREVNSKDPELARAVDAIIFSELTANITSTYHQLVELCAQAGIDRLVLSFVGADGDGVLKTRLEYQECGKSGHLSMVDERQPRDVSELEREVYLMMPGAIPFAQFMLVIESIVARQEIGRVRVQVEPETIAAPATARHTA